jgi:hypothetical protein
LVNESFKKRRLRRRDEYFLSRKELAGRWAISVREVIARERRGLLKPYRFSYKMTRFRLSDILAIEEPSKVS